MNLTGNAYGAWYGVTAIRDESAELVKFGIGRATAAAGMEPHPRD